MGEEGQHRLKLNVSRSLPAEAHPALPPAVAVAEQTRHPFLKPCSEFDSAALETARFGHDG